MPKNGCVESYSLALYLFGGKELFRNDLLSSQFAAK